MKRVLSALAAFSLLFFSCKNSEEDLPVSVTGVSISSSSLTLTEGESAQLTATVSPAKALEKRVTWSSSNSDVAMVDSNGKVLAVKAGSASVTATTIDGNKTASCAVTVVAKVIPVSGITLNTSSLNLIKGATETLVATITPADATDKTVTWSTSNAAVAYVENGLVTATGGGSATITALAGDKTATCEVTVTVPVSGIALSDASLALTVGDKQTLTATVTPEDATDKTVTWTSSDPDIASVTNGEVTAVAVGNATITAKAGDKEATCEITIAAKVIPVSGITLNTSSLNLIKGATETLVATVTPADATDKTVVWGTSNATVASVENGVVTAVGGGSATITALAGDKTATCTVTVTVPVSGIALSDASLALTVGDKQTLTATVTPEDASDKTVTWTSSAPGIASVTNGEVTAVAVGNATITAKAGDKTATCEVTVAAKVIPVTSITLDKTKLDLTKGSSAVLTATVTPNDATDKTVTWSSTNANIAAVADGIVIATGGGTATITAMAGDKTATCKVTVTVPVTGVALNTSSLTLKEGSKQTLTVTISPSDATDKTVTWTSSAPGIASVTNGEVTAVAAGNAIITAKAGDKEDRCTVLVTSKSVPFEMVDLGLSVKWANKNIGADTPEDYGNFYAWGETQPKDIYYWNTYKWCNGSENSLTKYNYNSEYGIVDNKTTLDPEDDVASVTLGGAWRMPSWREMCELYDCEWTWTNGGYKITGPSGNSIFLPAAGDHMNATYEVVGVMGNYWSNGLTESLPYDAFYLYFHDPDRGWYTTHPRCFGRSIRAVYGPRIIDVMSLSLDQTEVELGTGESITLVPTVVPFNATDPTVTWYSNSAAAVVINGKVTGMSPGTATIFAEAGHSQATCKVTVMSKNVPVTGISLNYTSLNLTQGGSATLVATVTPSNATDKTVYWGTSNANIASVSDGVVTATGEGIATITAMAGDKTATCKVTVDAPMAVPNAVDLGLSVKWASFNVGASVPEEYGLYYAWGETSPKSNYSWTNYQWSAGTYNSLSKYNYSALYGTVDDRYSLLPEDDVAHVKYKGNWRMPTQGEINELIANCSKTEKTINGVQGMEVTGKNGNSIFLPFAGLMASNVWGEGESAIFWTSQINYGSIGAEPCTARVMGLNINGAKGIFNSEGFRYYGYSVRAVLP